jgi:hypothetical protein
MPFLATSFASFSLIWLMCLCLLTLCSTDNKHIRSGYAGIVKVALDTHGVEIDGRTRVSAGDGCCTYSCLEPGWILWHC